MIQVFEARPSRAQLDADRRELAALQEGLAEARAEYWHTLSAGPAMEFLRWTRVVDSLERDIAELRAWLGKWRRER